MRFVLEVSNFRIIPTSTQIVKHQENLKYCLIIIAYYVEQPTSLAPNQVLSRIAKLSIVRILAPHQ